MSFQSELGVQSEHSIPLKHYTVGAECIRILLHELLVALVGWAELLGSRDGRGYGWVLEAFQKAIVNEALHLLHDFSGLFLLLLGVKEDGGSVLGFLRNSGIVNGEEEADKFSVVDYGSVKPYAEYLYI